MRATLGGRALEALCLDLDDTILDNEGSVRAAWGVVADLVRETHPDLARDVVLETIERAASWFWSDDERHRRGRLDLVRARCEVVSRTLSELGRPDARLAGHAAEVYTAFRRREIALVDGALDTLERLRAAIPRLALVTNGASVPQREKIERFGLARFFDHLQIEGEFGTGKPEASVFIHVLERLGAAAGASLMVGDDYRCDVLGALGAGLHAGWIDPTGRRATPTPAPRAHLVLRRLADLPRTIGI